VIIAVWDVELHVGGIGKCSSIIIIQRAPRAGCTVSSDGRTFAFAQVEEESGLSVNINFKR